MEYDLIAIGTGSAMSVVEAFLALNPEAKVAVIDKDEPGGICLTRGCIPSKILLYSAEVAREVRRSGNFGINSRIDGIDFRKVMGRMRRIIDEDIKMIEEGLKNSPNIDYFRDVAEFVEPYKLKVGDKVISSKKIIIGAGSKPLVPKIEGLEEAGYLTSDSLLKLEEMPESLAIIGGGYVAMEYGNFFAQLGCNVKIVEMADRILPNEELEISKFVERKMKEVAEIHTKSRVFKVEKRGEEKVLLVEKDGKTEEIEAEEILVAVGRAPNSDILKPEKGGIETERGWIKVNEYLETSVPGVYALGDAIGKHMFKHVANYEAKVVIFNAILGRKMKVNYKVVPHAVFTYPEVASVGLKEGEALEKFGKENVFVGFFRLEETGKGIAMDEEGFVKLIVKRDGEILGCHIAARNASILIQEVVLAMEHNLSVFDLAESMHIHPAQSEVVMWAASNLMSVDEYSKIREEIVNA